MAKIWPQLWVKLIIHTICLYVVCLCCDPHLKVTVLLNEDTHDYEMNLLRENEDWTGEVVHFRREVMRIRSCLWAGTVRVTGEQVSSVISSILQFRSNGVSGPEDPAEHICLLRMWGWLIFMSGTQSHFGYNGDWEGQKGQQHSAPLYNPQASWTWCYSPALSLTPSLLPVQSRSFLLLPCSLCCEGDDKHLLCSALLNIFKSVFKYYSLTSFPMSTNAGSTLPQQPLQP